MTSLTRSLRAHALRYPETREDFPWENDRVIKVRNKIFVFLGDRGIGVKLTNSNQAALGLRQFGPWRMALDDQAGSPSTCRRQSSLTWSSSAWIDESYRAVAPKALLARLGR